MESYWKQVANSLNIFKYKNIAKGTIAHTLSFFLSSLALSLLIGTIIVIPLLLFSSNKIADEFGKAETFTINVTLETSEPLRIPPHNPLVAVGNASMQDEMKGVPLAIAGETLRLSVMPGISMTTSLKQYGDLHDDADSSGRAAFILFVFLLPSILFFGALYYLVKYVCIAIVVSCIAYLIMRVVRKSLSYAKLFKVTLYSMFPYMLVELVLMPFGIPAIFAVSFAWFLLIIYLLWYVLICFEITEDF